MNYLAHLYLSASDKQLMLGNFIADRVKGNQYLSYPENIQQGILLHRSIDSFTDQHPVSKTIKRKLFPTQRHYSAVLVDMFYDHFLAKNWNQYSNISLAEYSGNCYKILIQFRDYLPDSSHRYLEAMHRYQWLESYQTVDGLNKVLSLMSQRTRFPSKLAESTELLKNEYSFFENLFFDFFPSVQQHVSETVKQYA